MTETLHDIALRAAASSDLAALGELNAVANEAAFRDSGLCNTCSSTSGGLHDARIQPGYQARMLRTEAAYDVARETIYDGLPDCRGCRCIPHGGAW